MSSHYCSDAQRFPHFTTSGGAGDVAVSGNGTDRPLADGRGPKAGPADVVPFAVTVDVYDVLASDRTGAVGSAGPVRKLQYGPRQENEGE